MAVLSDKPKKSRISPQPRVRSGSAEGSPCSERGVTAVLVVGSGGEVAFLVEVVVDGAVKGGEFLQGPHAPEAQHRPFSSSERLMAVLGAVVEPATCLAFADGAETPRRRAAGGQPIHDDGFGWTVPAERFAQEFQCRCLVAGPGQVAFKHLAFVIDGPPQVMLHTIDLHEHLVEVPAAVAVGPHRINAATPNLSCEELAEWSPPDPYRLMRDTDASFVQQILDIAQREGKRTYIIIAMRMISGEVLKCRKIAGRVMLGRAVPLP